eukprot:gene7789-9588_t
MLLLLKWPVIFKVFWNKGTPDEDKSTWSQIFLREFAPQSANNTDSNKSDADENGGGEDNNNLYGTKGDRSNLTSDQWKKAFRQDLENIGFEFDDKGEIKKFPPTEVMEQYQKSARFRELILSAGTEGTPRPRGEPEIVDSNDRPHEEFNNEIPTTTTTTTTTTTKSQPSQSQSNNKKRKNKKVT